MTFKDPITTEAQLRQILGYPTEIVTKKTINFIDSHCQSFIEKSPFITIATSDLDGNMDVSPKGDPPGFVKILDQKTLAIPDRPGNAKADSLTNIIKNPTIGLIFLIPGIRETLRINGFARIVKDDAILNALSCEGKMPKLAIIVTVKEAFFHCAKCIIRSKLWQVDGKIEGQIPSLAKVLVEHSNSNISISELDGMIKEEIGRAHV